MNLGEGLVKEFPAIINAFAGGVKEAATELVQGIGGLFKPEAGGPGAQVPNAKEATPDELRQGGTGDATTTVSLNGAKIASLTVKFKSGAVLGADETSKPEWSYANDANLDTLLDALPDTDSLSKLRLTNVLSTLKSKLVSVEYTLKYKFDGRIGFTSGKK